MEEKINFRLIFIALLSMVLTAVLTITVFHNVFEQQLKEDIRSYAHLLQDNYPYLEDKSVLSGFGGRDKMRITLISPEGAVLAESQPSQSRQAVHLHADKHFAGSLCHPSGCRQPHCCHHQLKP